MEYGFEEVEITPVKYSWKTSVWRKGESQSQRKELYVINESWSDGEWKLLDKRERERNEWWRNAWEGWNLAHTWVNWSWKTEGAPLFQG